MGSGKRQCSCGSEDIEHVVSTGVDVCSACGNVLEENQMVMDVTIATSGERSYVLGGSVHCETGDVNIDAMAHSKGAENGTEIYNDSKKNNSTNVFCIRNIQ